MSGNGRGLVVMKRSPESSKTSNNGKPSRKPRKKVPQRKKIERRKRRGEHLKHTAPSLPDIGLKDVDLAECIFSDEEEREDFMNDFPNDCEAPIVTTSSFIDNVDSSGCTVEGPPLSNIAQLSSSTQPLKFSSAYSGYVLPFSDTSQVAGAIETGVLTQDLSTSNEGTMELCSSTSAAVASVASVGNQEDQVMDSTAPESSVAWDNSEPRCLSSPTSDFVTMSSFLSPPSSDGVSCLPTSVIMQAVEKFRTSLPPLWVPIGDKKGFHLYRFSEKTPRRAIQREIFIPYNGDEEIFIHCEPLPFAKNLLKSVKVSRSILQANSIDSFCSRGVCIAKTLEQYVVCIGADLIELKDVWEHIGNSHIDKNPYQEVRYFTTCRSNLCERLIMLGRGKRCTHCSKVLRSLKQRRHSLLSQNPHPHTPNIHLTHEQAVEKLRLQHEELRKRDLKIAYLERRFKEILGRDGVDVARDLSEELGDVLANSNLSREQEFFFCEQFSCSGKADPRAHRWHPYMIRLALHLFMVSRSAYEDLRNSGVVKLPSSRTLYDYSHAFVAQEGISDGILNLAAERVEKLKKKHQKYVCVIADEVTISKNLVHRESDSQLLGFVHLDQVEKEIMTLEKELNGKEGTAKIELASKMLSFMVKGITSNVKYVVASYPCCTLTRDMLYARTWDLISRLERAAIRVLAVVADGL